MRLRHLTILFAVLAAALLPRAAHAQYSTCTEFACDSYGAFDPYSNEIIGYSRTVDYLWGWYLETYSSIQAPNGEGETTVATSQAEGYWEAEADMYYAPGQTGQFSIDGAHWYELEDNEVEDGESYYPVDVETPPVISQVTTDPQPWYSGGPYSVIVYGTGFAGPPWLDGCTGGIDQSSWTVTSTQISGSLFASPDLDVQCTVNIMLDAVILTSVALAPRSNLPNSMVVVQDYTSMAYGYAWRRVTYQVKLSDGVTNAPNIQLCEDDPSPPLSWSCSGQMPPLSLQVCSGPTTPTKPDGTFTDNWSMFTSRYQGCGYVGGADTWYWLAVGGTHELGALRGYMYSDSIQINGVVCPSGDPGCGMPQGTVIPK
jgi:hypothetical protein